MSRSWPEYFPRSRLRGKSTLSLVEVYMMLVTSSTFSHALRLNTINHQRYGIQKNNFNYQCAHIWVLFCSYFSSVVSFWSTNLFLRGYQVEQNWRVSCCIQKITEMVFTKDYFFSALLGGVVGGILTMLTLKILEARPREQTRVEVDNGRETGEGRIGIGVQESTKLEQEHDERCC